MIELEVQKYLRSGKSPDDLKEAYGINYARHNRFPKLITFKYDQLDSHSHRTDPLVRECRGLILDESLNWRLVAYPFKRFFNFGDGVADEINWDKACVQEKLDGSLAILYFFREEWRIASSGTPDAQGMFGLNDQLTMQDLFWQTLGNQVGWNWMQRMLARLPQTYTFMFELCTIHNRVVVRHEKDKLVLLGARDLNTHQEFRPGEVIHLFPNTEIPQVFAGGSAKEVIEMLYDMDGQTQEGFVVYDGTNRIKMKCPSYTALHHLTSNFTSMRLIMQNVIMREETAEVAAVFPEYADVLWEADKKYHDLISGLEEEYRVNKDIENQKDFALAVKNSQCSGALFALRAGKVSSIESFIAQLPADKVLKLLGYK